MNIIRHLSRRSMKKNQTTTIVTILGIIMSIALMTGLFVFGNSLLDFIRDEETIRQGDSHLVIYDVTRDYFEDLPGKDLIDQTRMMSHLGVEIQGEGDQFRYATIFGFDPERIQGMPFELSQGRMPQAPGEILITSDMNNHIDAPIRLGDQITLTVHELDNYDYNGELTPREMAPVGGTVVGVVDRNPTNYPFGTGYFIAQSPQELEAAQRLWVGVTLKHVTDETLEQFIQGIDQTIAPFMVTGLVDFYPGISSSIRFFVYGFVMTLAVIVGLAGIGLIQNGFLISLSQRLRELSVLSSVGMTKKQKWQMSLREGITLYLIGLPFGILFGIGAMVILFQVLTPLLQRTLETTATIQVVLDFKVLALIAVLGLITVLIASFIPALKTSRQTPLAGIRQQEDFTVTARSLRSPGFIRRLFGFEGELAWKNLRRNRRRYRGTLISLVFSLVLYLSLASVMQFADLSSQVAMLGRDDIVIQGQGREAFSQRAALEVLGTMEGIREKNVNYVTYGNTIATGDGTQEMIMDENGAIAVEILSFDEPKLQELLQSWGIEPSEITGEQAVLINEMRLEDPMTGRLMQQQIYRNPPTEMQVDLPTDEGDISSVTFDIVKVIDEPLPNYDSWDTAAKLVVSQNTLEALAEKSTVYLELNIVATERDHSALSDRLTTTIRDSELPLSLYDFQDEFQREQDFLIIAKILFFGFATIIALISLANIYNSLTSSLYYRRKEFAMLRSVGMEEASFRRMIRFESYFYAGKLLLYGLPLGVLASYGIYRYLIRTVAFNFHVPLVHFAVASLVVVGVLIAIMNLGSRRARRGNILETLKLEHDL